MTEFSLQHRFRHLKSQSQIINDGLAAGLDPANMVVDDKMLPKDQNKIDKKSTDPPTGLATLS
jgi:hypothetical protein